MNNNDMNMNHGRFVWHDLMTPDVKKSSEFYKNLMNWTITETTMNNGTYHMINVGDKKIGGFMQMEHNDTHHHPYWMGYVGVEDVDTATNAVTHHGGKIHMHPTTIPGIGRYSVVTDPTGGALSMIHEERPQHFDEKPMTTIGTFCWDELMTPNMEEAVKFYGNILPWTPMTDTPHTMDDYTVMKQHGTHTAAGVYNNTEHDHASWLAHILVDDLSAHMHKATELGAKIIMNETAVAGMGKFAILTDPVGAMFAMFEHTGK
jgi:uncharacterized protein